MISSALVVLFGVASALAPTAATRTTIVTDVTVIPVDTDEVMAHRTVVIRGDRIDRIVPSTQPIPMRGAELIDGRGKFLIPGLVDAHVHINNEGGITGSKDARLKALDLGNEHQYDRHVLLTFLRAGVTGAANLGGSPASDEHLLWLRDEVAAGRVPGPRLLVGKRINGPYAAVAAHPETPVPASTRDRPTTAEDGIAAVRAAHARGYDFIKPYQHLGAETYRAVVEESARLDMVTTGHLPELDCPTCADRAFTFAHHPTNIAHAEELARYGRKSNLAPSDIDDLSTQVAKLGISVTPTLITLKTIASLYVNRSVPAVPDGWDALVDPVTRLEWQGDDNRYLSAAFRSQNGMDMLSSGNDFARLLTRELWKKGVPLTVGTDAPLPGLVFGASVHQEMIEMREIGLPPMEVLRAATINAHRLFEPGQQEGAVRAGHRADLVLLDANPLDDIQNIRRIDGVFAQGRWLPRERIDSMLAQTSAYNATLAKQLQTTESAPDTAPRPAH